VTLGVFRYRRNRPLKVLVVMTTPSVELVALRLQGPRQTVIRAYGAVRRSRPTRMELRTCLARLMMPEVNGFESGKRSSSRPPPTASRIVVVTAKHITETTAPDRMGYVSNSWKRAGLDPEGRYRGGPDERCRATAGSLDMGEKSDPSRKTRKT